MTRRAAEASADIQHVHVASQSQPTNGLVDGLGPQVMILIEAGQQIGINRVIGPDAERRELVEHSIDLLVELHPLDARARGLGSGSCHRRTPVLLRDVHYLRGPAGVSKTRPTPWQVCVK